MPVGKLLHQNFQDHDRKGKIMKTIREYLEEGNNTMKPKKSCKKESDGTCDGTGKGKKMKSLRNYLKEAKSDWDGTEFSTSEDIDFKAAKLKLKADVEYIIKQKGKVLEIIDNDNDAVIASLSEKQVDDFFEEFGDDLDIM